MTSFTTVRQKWVVAVRACSSLRLQYLVKKNFNLVWVWRQTAANVWDLKPKKGDGTMAFNAHKKINFYVFLGIKEIQMLRENILQSSSLSGGRLLNFKQNSVGYRLGNYRWKAGKTPVSASANLHFHAAHFKSRSFQCNESLLAYLTQCWSDLKVFCLSNSYT